jgi:carnitine 3-dehydrogenase
MPPAIEPEAVDRIALLGAGTIGASWAAHFLARGFAVSAHDPAPDGERRMRDYIARVWPMLEQLGLRPGADPDRVSFHADPAAAVRDAPFVQENAPERLEVKRELFAAAEPGLAPEAVVASSSSGLLVSDIQEGRAGPERYVLGHPFNPPHLIPLVEVVGGRRTDPAVVDWTVAFYNAHGKRAIRINKEVLAHVANRLQAAMWREAVHLVNEGVASVEDVDVAIAYGPGLRWAIMGPHLTFHLAGGEGGMRHYLEHLGPSKQVWWADLGQPELTPEVNAKLIAGVDAEARGRSPRELAAERDALLVALMRTLHNTREALARADEHPHEHGRELDR